MNQAVVEASASREPNTDVENENVHRFAKFPTDLKSFCRRVQNFSVNTPSEELRYARRAPAFHAHKASGFHPAVSAGSSTAF